MRIRDLASLGAAALLPLACVSAPKPPSPPGGIAPPAERGPEFTGDAAVGSVFHDLDGDGQRDPGEPGIAGVRVSNGVDVVRTDPAGRYRLPVGRDTTLFVIKPRDWQVPIDALGLPRFYYLHKPDGSPDEEFRYPGVAPTGPLPAAVDFALVPRPESERFQAVAIADPQPYDAQQLAWYSRRIVSELAERRAAHEIDPLFALSLGDLVGNDLSLLEPLSQLQSLVEIPWYNVLGNHDLNFLAADDASSDETFERHFGPSTYAFQVARVLFVVLDDVLWLGDGKLKLDGRPDTKRYAMGLREDQLRFVENLLTTVAADELVLLAMHIPLEVSRQGEGGEPLRLLEVLSRHPHTGSLAGHRHRMFHLLLGEEAGYRPLAGERGELHHQLVVGTASGSWHSGAPDPWGLPHATMADGTPPGYALLEFDGSDWRARYKAAGLPAEVQLQIHAPDRVLAGRIESAAPVVVNVWNGGPQSRIEMRVGDRGAWREMRRVKRPDPFFEELLEAPSELAAPGRPLPEPRAVEHLWSLRLPTALSPGAHWIEVRGEDGFGQPVAGRRPLIVDQGG